MVAAKCRKCNTIDPAVTKVTIQNLSAPGTAEAGSLIEVRFLAVNDVLGPNANIAICMYDEATGQIVNGTEMFTIPQAASIQIILQYIMPNRDVNLNVSLVEDLILYTRCDDFKIVSIKVTAPPGQGYSCNQVTKTCISDPNSTITYDKCVSQCSTGIFGGCSNCDISQNMCIIGMCLPKPVVLIGLAAIIYTMMKQ